MLLAIGYSDTCSFSVVPSCPMDKRCMSAPDQPCRSTRRLGTAVKSHLPPLQLRGATFAFALVRPLELSEMQVLRCQRDVVLRAGACYDRSARSRHLGEAMHSVKTVPPYPVRTPCPASQAPTGTRSRRDSRR